MQDYGTSISLEGYEYGTGTVLVQYEYGWWLWWLQHPSKDDEACAISGKRTTSNSKLNTSIRCGVRVWMPWIESLKYFSGYGTCILLWIPRTVIPFIVSFLKYVFDLSAAYPITHDDFSPG